MFECKIVIYNNIFTLFCSSHTSQCKSWFFAPFVWLTKTFQDAVRQLFPLSVPACHLPGMRFRWRAWRAKPGKIFPSGVCWCPFSVLHVGGIVLSPSFGQSAADSQIQRRRPETEHARVCQETCRYVFENIPMFFYYLYVFSDSLYVIPSEVALLFARMRPPAQ